MFILSQFTNNAFRFVDLNRYYDNQFECDKKLVSEKNVYKK